MDSLTLTSFLTDFAPLPDPRIARHRRYPLLEVLLLCVSAGVSGYQTWEEIVDFGRLKLDWLRQYLPFAHGIPSHDTVNRVLRLLDARAFEQCLLQWSSRSLHLPDGTQVCFDGKRLRRSATAAAQQTPYAHGGHSAVHLVHAWCDAAGLCLGQYRSGTGSHEALALPPLLALLDVRGCVVSADAAFAQPACAEALVAAGAEYVLALKANQPTLLAAAQAAFAAAEGRPAAEGGDYVAPAEKPRHGRHETRRCRVLPLAALGLAAATTADWPALATVVEVTATRRFVCPPGAPQGRPDTPTTETRYYLSSLGPALGQASSGLAQRLEALVRRHWSVENRLHWVLDVVMGEDQSRKRAGHAAANYAVIRKFSLNLLRAMPETISLARKQNHCAISDDYRHRCLQF